MYEIFLNMMMQIGPFHHLRAEITEATQICDKNSIIDAVESILIRFSNKFIPFQKKVIPCVPEYFTSIDPMKLRHAMNDAMVRVLNNQC